MLLFLAQVSRQSLSNAQTLESLVATISAGLQTRSQPFKECFKLTTCKPQGWKALRTHNCEHSQPSQLWLKTVHAVLLKRDLKSSIVQNKRF